jgi:predicted alpha/beta-fold hydrolase
LAFNGHWQAFLFPWVENVINLRRKMTYTEEIFTLSDKGTLLLQWSVCEDGKQSKRKINIQESDELSKRKNPLMILVNGLSGGSSNLY